ncbi:tRNA (adenosine(37)-N6)-dimethylallyltransferase MiaA [Peptoniphilus equinus]|uniref:tRNA dimethylallyltransferase n=1 Tax=Peptoniphilus equinus TaxID=3016343 RepID=A0ABY7QX78_9FIRM|nr:tRNA (adenosine(37)-N6)-dimethylallyltransferase MiaA [Peptoniphilus equinus]WBW50699.1 tRNA (adenosine(37)-N6)-dimethylallyltransferase MiaA [Peptoniphilus equinus]
MKLFILTGPTGIGKTELSLQLARSWHGEIISADSMQVYKNFDIGTAKIMDRGHIPHHMIDITTANEEFSVYDFQTQTKSLITQINDNNRLPMLVGGTGLYIDSIVYHLSFQAIGKDVQLRKTLEKDFKAYGVTYLFEKLKTLDPNAAHYIDPKNPQRLMRAIEIASSAVRETENLRRENNEYELLYIGLTMPRQKLYERINHRVINMVEQGLIDEVQRLVAVYGEDCKPFRAIGYKEVIAYLKGMISYDEMIDTIQKNSRHYAKRQLTYFRRDQRIHWIDREDPKLLDKILELGKELWDNV